MNEKDALFVMFSIIDHACRIKGANALKEIIEAKEILADLVERSIAKEVVVWRGFPYMCPNTKCNKSDGLMRLVNGKEVRLSHCFNCDQKLDWSDEK